MLNNLVLSEAEKFTLAARLKPLLWPVGLANIFLVIQIILLLNYSKMDPIASLSWFAVDSWCDADGGQGWGVHCFGDYSMVRNAIESGNPWSADFRLNYPPSALVLHLIGFAVERATSSFNAGLFTYLFLLFSALSTPWLLAASSNSHLTGAEKVMALSVVGPFSVPSLIVIDRGNSVGFVVAALLVAALGAKRNNPLMYSIGVVAAGMVKPQLFILATALLSKKEWRLFFGTATAAIVSNLILLGIVPGKFVDNLGRLSTSILGYGEAISVSQSHPLVVSFSKVIYLASWTTLGSPAAKLAGIIASLALICLILALHRRFSFSELFSLLLIVTTFALPITYGYYLALISIVVIARCLNEPRLPNSDPRFSIAAPDEKMERFSNLLFRLAVVSSVSALIMPVSTGPYGTLWTTLEAAPFFWLLFSIGEVSRHGFLIGQTMRRKR